MEDGLQEGNSFAKAVFSGCRLIKRLDINSKKLFSSEVEQFEMEGWQEHIGTPVIGCWPDCYLWKLSEDNKIGACIVKTSI